MDDRPSGKNNFDNDNTSMDCDHQNNVDVDYTSMDCDQAEEWVMDGEEEVGKSGDSKWSEGTQWSHGSNPVHESLPTRVCTERSNSATVHESLSTRECTERSNSAAMDWKSDPKLTDASLRPVVRVQPLKLLCCRFCNMSFPDGCAVEKHCEQNHPEETGKNSVQCGKCLYIFRVKMTTHGHQTHMNSCWQKPFKVTATGKVDLKLSQRLTRQKNKRKPILCEMCSHVSYQLGNHRNHMATKHATTKEKTVACPLCPAKHYSYFSSRSHFKKKHAPKPFACSQCPKAFVQKEELDDHVAAHQGIRKYECEICSKRFYTKQKRTQHKLIVHKQSMIQCDVCAVF
jgi:hypothetical protein